MKFIDIQQNTQEWLNFRKEKIGASDCSSIMGDNPFKNILQLWEEKFELEKVNSFRSAAAQRGHDLEPLAREKYNQISGLNFVPKVGISCEREWQSASFDGIDVKAKVILEIKCPGENVWQKIVEGNVPLHYGWQIQHQLCVSGYQRAILFVFKGEGEKFIELKYERNEELIKRLIAAETHFYEINMLQWKSPVERKKKPVIRLELEDLLKEAYEAQQDMVYSKKKFEDLKQDIKHFCNNESVESAFYKFVKTTRKGSVDYSKIPELDGVDLNLYRKEATESWTIGLANEFPERRL